MLCIVFFKEFLYNSKVHCVLWMKSFCQMHTCSDTDLLLPEVPQKKVQNPCLHEKLSFED